ncbi:MAG: hypothetical protein ACHQQS_15460 [Thermoanaerobaculales bacterium]
MKRCVALLAVVLAALGSVAVASAQVEIGVRVRVAPPVVRVETVPLAPGPDSYWIGGHWQWDDGQFTWRRGHWVVARRGEVYVRAHWVPEGAEWVFRPGHWARIVPPAGYEQVIVNAPPPPLRVDVMTPPPSADHFWIAGHWRWENRRYEWEAGRWELHHPGSVWVPAHWVRVNGVWRFAGGHWQPY